MEQNTVDCEKHGPNSRAFFPKGRAPRCASCNTLAVNNRRKFLKQKAVILMGGKCCKCGYSKSIWALDFHHTDPSKKDFAIAGKGITRSWAKTEEELKKTILICKNCHAELHSKDNLTT